MKRTAYTQIANAAGRAFAVLATVVWVLAAAPEARGQGTDPKPLAFLEGTATGPVYVVPVEGMIDKGLARYIDRALAEAAAANASLVFFHVNTFGGLVDAADEIRQDILNAPVPTLAFIDKNAASAGALISYAADRIVMVPGASIGAATVVEGTTGAAAPDKYQSYMRGLMRSTAEANGRDPRIAEAMVDPAVFVEGVVDSGKVLTLSAQEAYRFGVADAVRETRTQVLAELGLAEAAVVEHHATRLEEVLRFFGSPVVQSILMLLMLGGLYFELQTPGVGFPGLAALVGGLLFFAPHYMLGLVESWELLLFLVGIALLGVEFFVLPGFGFAGIGGLVLVVVSLLASLVPNVGLRFPGGEAITTAVVTLAVTLLLLVGTVVVAWRYLPRSEQFNRLVLKPELSSATGYTSADTVAEMLGRTGVAMTPLRPAGVAEIDGQRVDVITAGQFVSPGTPVRVVRVRGSRVEVTPSVATSAQVETSKA